MASVAPASGSFSINLPLPTASSNAAVGAQPTASYLAPGLYQPAPAMPTTGYPGAADSFTSTTGTSLSSAVSVGGMAGYKAPRGIDGVRRKLSINRYGESVGSGRSSRSYGRSGRYDSYSRSGRYGSSNRGYRSYSRGGSRVGSSRSLADFGIGSAIKSSIIWGGVASVATHAYRYFNKQESGATSTAGVAGDLVSAAVGGTAGAVASYMGCGMLAAMGLGGLALTGAGILLGVGGYFLADSLLRSTSLFQGFQGGVYKLLGGT